MSARRCTALNLNFGRVTVFRCVCAVSRSVSRQLPFVLELIPPQSYLHPLRLRKISTLPGHVSVEEAFSMQNEEM